MQFSCFVAPAGRCVILLVRRQLKGVPFRHPVAARIVLRDAKRIILVRHPGAERNAACALGAARLPLAGRILIAPALGRAELLGALFAGQHPSQSFCFGALAGAQQEK